MEGDDGPLDSFPPTVSSEGAAKLGLPTHKSADRFFSACTEPLFSPRPQGGFASDASPRRTAFASTAQEALFLRPLFPRTPPYDRTIRVLCSLPRRLRSK